MNEELEKYIETLREHFAKVDDPECDINDWWINSQALTSSLNGLINETRKQKKGGKI